MDKRHRRWLLELTNLPTAAGREDRVIEWVRQYASRRPSVKLSADAHGNLTLSRKGDRSRRPIYFTAHMDHPAFVVEQVVNDRRVVAGFRGGVERTYFRGTSVRLYPDGGPAVRGMVKSLRKSPDTDDLDANRIVANIELDEPTHAAVGDVVTWDVGESRIVSGRLHAPACDDVAAVAAAIAAFDQLGTDAPVRVLLTRGEEYGFLGAIGACRDQSVPQDASLICLENSRSYAESPIGGGPIVRVGDRTYTFDPELTYAVGHVAERLAAERRSFKWQRRLMPGGTCEASAFTCYGYRATCVCLPLGNYHNMNRDTGRIDAERISVRDCENLIELLVACGRTMDRNTPQLKPRLEALFASRKYVLQT